MSLRIGIGKNLRITPSGGLTFCPEYQAVWNAFPTKPIDTDAINQNTWMNGMVNGGYFAKAEFLDLFSCDTQANSLFDWHNPIGAFNPTLVNAPVFTAYGGFTGNVAGIKYVRLHFRPNIDKILISQNNICAIIGVGTDLNEVTYDFGAYDVGPTKLIGIASRRLANFESYCNSALSGTTANANGKKHYAISRNIAANYDTYINLTKTNKVAVSNGMTSFELYACALNTAGVATPCNRQVRYAFLFNYLTEAEVQGVINLTENYLDNYGMGMI